MKRILGRIAVAVVFLSAMFAAPQSATASCYKCKFQAGVGPYCDFAIGEGGNEWCNESGPSCIVGGYYCMYSGGNLCIETPGGGIVCVEHRVD